MNFRHKPEWLRNELRTRYQATKQRAGIRRYVGFAIEDHVARLQAGIPQHQYRPDDTGTSTRPPAKGDGGDSRGDGER